MLTSFLSCFRRIHIPHHLWSNHLQHYHNYHILPRLYHMCHRHFYSHPLSRMTHILSLIPAEL